jgi:hypothetical protein
MATEVAYPVSAEKRAKLFHEGFDSSCDASSTLVELVIAAGRFLGTMVGEEPANAAMAGLVDRLTESGGGSSEPVKPDEWVQALEEGGDMYYSEWPLGELFHNLSAFADYGIALHGGATTEEREHYLGQIIDQARAFLSSAPMDLWQIKDRMLDRLVAKAEGRWAIDHGQPIKPEALANLGGLSEGRIRNMMSGANRTFTNKDGAIPAAEALAWLSERKEFATSLWREQSLPDYGTDAVADLAEVFFVPVARDGSVFNPGLASGGNYTIGAKSAERHVTGFEEALAQLQKMSPAPYWRRPNDQGNWGIVRGMRWERMDAKTLATFATDPGKRL